MSSIFGDDGVDDLINDNIPQENEELPDGNEDEQLFGEEKPEGEQDEEAEGKPVKVEPKKRSIRNPRLKLSVDTLSGSRGIHTIEDYFKDIKYKGKGHEKHDLDEVLRRLQHWGHRMYPTYTFDDILNKIEQLGKKKTLHVHMTRYRLGMLQPQHIGDELDDEDGVLGENGMLAGAVADEPYDEFDALLGEQIAISKLAPRTPAASSRYGGGSSVAAGNTTTMSSHSSLATPSFRRGNIVGSTPFSTPGSSRADALNAHDMSDLAQPLPPSQPGSPPAAKAQLSAEQMARIAENRRLAQERKMAKILQQQQQTQLPVVVED